MSTTTTIWIVVAVVLVAIGLFAWLANTPASMDDTSTVNVTVQPDTIATSTATSTN